MRPPIERSSWSRSVLALACALALTQLSCVNSSSTWFVPDAGTDASRPPIDAGERDGGELTPDDATRMVLASVADRVIVPALRELETRTEALRAATSRLATSGSAEDRAAAREAWLAAMQSWERLEVFTLGPGAAVMGGGLGLRDELYSWPLVNRCRIDQTTVSADHETAEALAGESISVRTLGALEYLLFFEEPTNGCTATSAINATGQWAALGETEIARRRAVYARSAAELVAARATELRMRWESGVDGAPAFRDELARAGAGSATYATAQAGLNALTDALFYVEIEVKDLKLARPAGLMECTTTTCPELLESRWADRSRDHLLANVRAFQSAYLGADPGTDAPGIDDLLIAVGAAEMDARMRTALDAAIAALEALDASLIASLAAGPEQMVAAFMAVKAATDILKTEICSVLDLDLPMRAEGDTD